MSTLALAARPPAREILTACADFWRHQRPQRMAILLLAGLALSGFDLAMTMKQASGAGMLEGNPIARALVAGTGSVLSLAGLKCLSVGVCMGLLFGLRRHWQAEAGAWLAASILVGVSGQWVLYQQFVGGLDVETARGLAQHADWMVAR